MKPDHKKALDAIADKSLGLSAKAEERARALAQAPKGEARKDEGEER